MGHDIGKELPPYRIEWRSDLTTNWVRLGEADTHDAARAAVDIQLRSHGGQVRAIVQHVIAVKGLGA